MASARGRAMTKQGANDRRTTWDPEFDLIDIYIGRRRLGTLLPEIADPEQRARVRETVARMHAADERRLALGGH